MIDDETLKEYTKIISPFMLKLSDNNNLINKLTITKYILGSSVVICIIVILLLIYKLRESKNKQE